MVKAIGSHVEFKQLISSSKPVIVDFWATWCGPCRMMSPIFESLEKAHEGAIFVKVDVDAQPDIAQEVGITAMPTFIAFKDGNKLDDLLGADPSKLEINGSTKPVIVDFYASWCGPCKTISPIFEKLESYYSNAIFVKVDIDDQGEIAEAVGVKALPTFMVFKNGEKVDELLGANPSQLKELIIRFTT